MAELKVSSLFFLRGQACETYRKPDWTDPATHVSKPGGFVFQVQARVSLSNGEFRRQIQDVSLGNLSPEQVKPWRDAEGKPVEVCVSVRGGSKEAVYVSALPGSGPVLLPATAKV